jgi:hypothetical protein
VRAIIPPPLEDLPPARLNLRIPGIGGPLRAAEALLTHPAPALRAALLLVEGVERLPLAAPRADLGLAAHDQIVAAPETQNDL